MVVRLWKFASTIFFQPQSNVANYTVVMLINKENTSTFIGKKKRKKKHPYIYRNEKHPYIYRKEKNPYIYIYLKGNHPYIYR